MPNMIVIDEATAALDVESETRLLNLLFERLPETTVLSVGHREGLEAVHSQKITLVRHPDGARIRPAEPPGLKRLRQRFRWARFRV